ncbi:ABC transporter substrate-binding protein [bacterium]|nr:ABC transporter substrate-binding protein [bacterium]
MRIYFLIGMALIVSFTSCKKEKTTSTQPVVTPPAPVAEAPLVPGPSINFTPMEAIKDLDKKVDGYKTGTNLSNEDIQANQKLKTQIIRGTFDLRELSILALDKHWNTLSDKDRNHFVELMVQLLEKKAIFSKEHVKGNDKSYKISYLSEEFLDPEKTKSQVVTRIAVPSEKVDLQIKYKLRHSSHGWQIFDVIVDDASLVDNYKFQFDTIITKYGFPDLITRMETKLKEMK